MNGIVFAIIVNIPTLVLTGLSFAGGAPREYGRRALVAYGALLTVAFGALLAAASANPLVLYAALLAGFVAAAISGPWGLLIAAAALAVLTGAGALLPMPFSTWAPAIALTSVAAIFIQSRLAGSF